METINSVYIGLSKSTRVTDRNIGIAVCWGAIYDGLLLKGYTINRISSHSLQVGGVMALKLSGAPDSTIMRIGRWSGPLSHT